MWRASALRVEARTAARREAHHDGDLLAPIEVGDGVLRSRRKRQAKHDHARDQSTSVSVRIETLLLGDGARALDDDLRRGIDALDLLPLRRHAT